MKTVIFTYDAIKNGESGEACTAIPLEDERAAKIKAATENPSTLSKREAFDLRNTVAGFLKACERVRGRVYVDESIKSIEIEEV